MDQGTVARIEEWDGRPFPGGYGGLRDLADADFSGAVTAAGAWLFMLNGRIIGVFDGSLSSFEGAEGRAYAAPDPSLPLLFAMRETGGETEGRYYTDDTPLAEVERTLSEGGFAGYIELSENVLSGDYYVVFYGGRSMSVAFVGRSERLLTGEDAFEQAENEVGIYEVNSVDLEVRDVPEPETPAGGAAGATDAPTGDETSRSGGAGSAPPADAPDGGSTDAAEPSAGETDAARSGGPAGEADSPPPGDPEPTEAGDDPPSPVTRRDGTPAEPTDGRTGPGGEGGDPEPGEGDVETGSRDGGPEPTPGQPPGGGPAAEDPPAEREGPGGSSGAEESPAGRSGTGDEAPEPLDAGTSGGEPSGGSGMDPTAGAGDDAGDAGAGGTESGEDPFSEEEAWREDRSVPPLDPEEDEGAGGMDEAGTEVDEQAETRTESDEKVEPRREVDEQAGAGTEADERAETGTETDEGIEAGPDPDGGSETTAGTDEGPAAAGTGGQADRGTPSADTDAPAAGGSRVRELREAVEAREERIEELRDRLEAVGEERDRLKAERDSLAEERDRLEEELDRLQRRVGELEERLEATGGAGRHDDPGAISPEEALSATDLFVRYGSKGKATLEEAHDGDASREEVNANLRLENHTRFEAEGATVDGEPYAAFLESTLEFRFVEWLVEDLLYEIRDAGAEKGLRDLYDTLPDLDRVAFGDTVTAEDEGGEEYSRQFDVVCRDRMGQPLVVADLNDARDPATGEMMGSLVERSGDVAGAYETLAAAFLVTASFFEPDALETVADATGGGLLNRGSRRSFVKLSRKQGYHLCLVEARRGAFHVAVPEL